MDKKHFARRGPYCRTSYDGRATSSNRRPRELEMYHVNQGELENRSFENSVENYSSRTLAKARLHTKYLTLSLVIPSSQVWLLTTPNIPFSWVATYTVFVSAADGPLWQSNKNQLRPYVSLLEYLVWGFTHLFIAF